jgi:hypothetical protein
VDYCFAQLRERTLNPVLVPASLKSVSISEAAPQLCEIFTKAGINTTDAWQKADSILSNAFLDPKESLDSYYSNPTLHLTVKAMGDIHDYGCGPHAQYPSSKEFLAAYRSLEILEDLIRRIQFI